MFEVGKLKRRPLLWHAAPSKVLLGLCSPFRQPRKNYVHVGGGELEN